MVFLPGTDRSVCEMEDVMKIDTQIVDRYLSGKPLLTDEEDRIPLDQSALVMDRREVVAELKTRTLASLQQFPSFNPALCFLHWASAKNGCTSIFSSAVLTSAARRKAMHRSMSSST